jgi:hypothetical protein
LDPRKFSEVFKVRGRGWLGEELLWNLFCGWLGSEFGVRFFPAKVVSRRST